SRSELAFWRDREAAASLTTPPEPPSLPAMPQVPGARQAPTVALSAGFGVAGAHIVGTGTAVPEDPSLALLTELAPTDRERSGARPTRGRNPSSGARRHVPSADVGTPDLPLPLPDTKREGPGIVKSMGSGTGVSGFPIVLFGPVSLTAPRLIRRLRSNREWRFPSPVLPLPEHPG